MQAHLNWMVKLLLLIIIKNSHCAVGCRHPNNNEFHVDSHIVNSETKMKFGDNEVGKTQISSQSVTLGYYDQKDITILQFHATIEKEKNIFAHIDLGFICKNKLLACRHKKDLIIIISRNYP